MVERPVHQRNMGIEGGVGASLHAAIAHRPLAHVIVRPRHRPVAPATGQLCRRLMRPELTPEAPFWQVGWHHYAVADAAELARK